MHLRYSPWAHRARALLGWKQLGVGLASAVSAAAVQAIPTAVIPNPLFERMTAVRPDDYVFLGATSVLIGLIFSTFGLSNLAPSCQNRTLGSGLMSALAIGCPICNHVVVATIGISGALTYWAPLQPVLGATAVLILLWTLVKRLQAIAPLPEVDLVTRPTGSSASQVRTV